MRLRRGVVRLALVSILVLPSLARAQDQGSLTQAEAQLEQRLRPVLNYALDTLSLRHSLPEAVQFLKQAAASNASLRTDLLQLSKTEQQSVRNLALWCLEAGFPDPKAVWKSIITDGRVMTLDGMKEAAGQLAFLIKAAAVDWNAGADMHTVDVDTKPALSVKDFVGRYGAPDRRATLTGTEVGDKKRLHNWIFYGPVGVKLDESESHVLGSQFAMSAILWMAAFKAYGQDFAPIGEFNGESRERAVRIPDLNGLFLRIGAVSAPASPRK
jgi:hypothetical protein